jgi:hypothetical protein
MGAGEAKDANPGAARLFGLHLRDAESFALSIISSWGEIGMTAARALRDRFRATVFAIVDVRSSPDQPLSDAVETVIRREDAERFIAEVRGNDRELASYLQIEERELHGGPLKCLPRSLHERVRDVGSPNQV